MQYCFPSPPHLTFPLPSSPSSLTPSHLTPSHYHQLASDKKTQLRTLDRKVRPMEDLFKEFRAWLGATEKKLGDLSPPAGESGEREQQLQEAKVGRWKEGRVGR